MGAAGLPFVHGFRVEKMRNWFGGICMGVHLPSFRPWLLGGENEKADFLSSMAEGARKDDVREKIKKRERKDK
jgi:hypothetical protein